MFGDPDIEMSIRLSVGFLSWVAGLCDISTAFLSFRNMMCFFFLLGFCLVAEKTNYVLLRNNGNVWDRTRNGQLCLICDVSLLFILLLFGG